MSGDDVLAIRCPRCAGEIVYNGNYFCDERACGWARPDDAEPMTTILVAAFHAGWVRREGA